MDPKNQFILSFRAIQVKFSRLYTQILTCIDLTFPQFALLNLLTDDGAMPMTEASQKLFITKPAVTNLVDRLEEKKLLRRVPDEKDRRVYILKVEKKGADTVNKVRAYVLGYLLETLDQFQGNEKKTIARFYELLSLTMDSALKKQKKRK